jgi:hypothetical protein
MDFLTNGENEMGLDSGESRPACSNLSVAENITGQGDSLYNNKQNFTKPIKKRQVNSRGHDKNFPRSMIVPDHHKKQPHLIVEAKNRCAESFKTPLKYNYGKISYHPDRPKKDYSYRKARSESRESLTHPGIQILLHHLNLLTMKCGIFDQKIGKFIPFKPEFLAKKSGMHYSQFMRTLHRLEDNGYINLIKEIYINHAGKKRYKPIVIQFNLLFFYDLGFTDSDIGISTKKVENKESQILIGIKANQYKKDERSNKKKAKVEIRTLRDLIGAARCGEKLKENEEKLLDHEQPGWRGQKKHEDIYPDFTGLAHDKEAILKKIYGVKKCSEIQTHFMSQTIKKLSVTKKPPD